MSLAWRIGITVFFVYALHFASNVVRETYLAITLGERLSIRVDEYLGLHPDLFVVEGRGAFINNNPGASLAGALPYAVATPFIRLLFRLRPELAQPKPPSTYADDRPNRTLFMNRARERGLDIKLALAAMSMQVGLMAPLGAVAAVAMFLFLRARLGDERRAVWLALLYAFGTPVFFRSAFLNQNALVAHAALFAFVLLAGPVPPGASVRQGMTRTVAAGALLGFALLCDYGALPLLLAFGVWAVARGWMARGLSKRGDSPERDTDTARRAGAGVRAGLAFALGAAGPIVVLLGYQWAAFGNAFLPAQHYMPDTQLSVRGWNGFALPTADLLWRNLLDPRYGLFVFCPMLAAALLAPFVRGRARFLSADELALALGASAALWLFSSANQYAALQWNTGVRYLVPAAPLLFLALVPVLPRLPAPARWLLVLTTLVVSWCVAMAREDVPTSLVRIFVGGFELPFLTVLGKTASAYAPFLEGRASPLPLFALVGIVLWLIWRPVPRRSRD